MAKRLTPEQKAINKKATALRQTAFYRRSKALSDACKSAIAAVDAGPIKRQQMAANEALNAAMAARKERQMELQRQIRDLQREFERIEQEAGQEIDRLSDNYRAANNELQQAYKDATAPIRAEYADVDNRYSAVQWKHLEDFTEEAEAALKSGDKA